MLLIIALLPEEIGLKLGLPGQEEGCTAWAKTGGGGVEDRFIGV